MNDFVYVVRILRGIDRTEIASATCRNLADVTAAIESFVITAQHAEDHRDSRIEIALRSSSLPDNYCNDAACPSCNGVGADGHHY